LPDAALASQADVRLKREVAKMNTTALQLSQSLQVERSISCS
jgi:hypothetical protein